MSESGQDEPRSQSFYGPGSFGGDNNGTINNILLDPKTKVVLTDLGRKAPELAALLRQALRDGFISPDAVIALNRAVDHINMDVAEAFMFAARHINEDVAVSFETIAEKFTAADRELSARIYELNDASESLSEMLGKFNSAQRVSAPDYQLEAASAAGMVTRPSPQGAEKWRNRLLLICWSSGVSLVAAVIFTLTHLGVYSALAGALILLLAVLLQFGKARR